MFRITVTGLVLMAIGYWLLGPAPPLLAVLGSLHQPWLVWVSLSVAGVGAGMAFVPLLPAMLTSLAAVSIRALVLLTVNDNAKGSQLLAPLWFPFCQPCSSALLQYARCCV